MDTIDTALAVTVAVPSVDRAAVPTGVGRDGTGAQAAEPEQPAGFVVRNRLLPALGRSGVCGLLVLLALLLVVPYALTLGSGGRTRPADGGR